MFDICLSLTLRTKAGVLYSLAVLSQTMSATNLQRNLLTYDNVVIYACRLMHMNMLLINNIPPSLDLRLLTPSTTPTRYCRHVLPADVHAQEPYT